MEVKIHKDKKKKVQRKLKTILMSINRRLRGLHIIKLYTDIKRDDIF